MRWLTLALLLASETEACQITQPVDGRHCDAELWGPILRDAADRLEAPR